MLVDDAPENVATFEKLPLRAVGMEKLYADSLLEITRDIAVEAGISGSYGGFSASINNKFSQSQKQTEKKHFLKLSMVVSGNHVNLRNGKSDVLKYMNAEFKQALAGAAPEELFAQYGTHVATKMRTGGKADYYCQSKDNTSMSSEDFELAATAKYASAGGSVEGSTKINQSRSEHMNQIVGSEGLTVIGGATDLATAIKPGGGWSEWAKSTYEYPGILGFDPEGLVPIWELAGSDARKAVIYEGYKRRAATKYFRTEMISQTSAPASHHPDLSVPIAATGYKMICGGARDSYGGAGNMLVSSYPSDTKTWRAVGKDHVVDDPATVTVSALAIYDPDDIWEVQRFESPVSGQSSRAEAQIKVPPSHVMIGGGAEVTYTGVGQLLYASFPKDDATWLAKAKDHFRGDGSGTMKAYALGLRSKVNGVRLVQHINHSDASAQNKQEIQEPPPPSIPCNRR